MKEKFDMHFVFHGKEVGFTIDLNHFYYLPFIGWMYPMAFKKGDAAATQHAKQGFVMALFFTGLLIAMSFSTIFIHTGYRALRLSIAIAIYLAELLYLYLCVWGTMMIVKGKQFDVPVIRKYADKINI
jgi:hypothetical protein